MQLHSGKLVTSSLANLVKSDLVFLMCIAIDIFEMLIKYN